MHGHAAEKTPLTSFHLHAGKDYKALSSRLHHLILIAQQIRRI